MELRLSEAALNVVGRSRQEGRGDSRGEAQQNHVVGPLGLLPGVKEGSPRLKATRLRFRKLAGRSPMVVLGIACTSLRSLGAAFRNTSPSSKEGKDQNEVANKLITNAMPSTLNVGKVGRRQKGEGSGLSHGRWDASASGIACDDDGGCDWHPHLAVMGGVTRSGRGREGQGAHGAARKGKPVRAPGRNVYALVVAALCAFPPASLLPRAGLRLGVELVLGALAAGAGTSALMQPISTRALSRGLCGADLNKERGKKVPEAGGLAAAAAFLGSAAAVAIGKGPSALIAEYNAGLLSIAEAALAGFADDVLDLPWRVKLALPCAASASLLASYKGPTNVLLPKPVRALLPRMGEVLELGQVYKAYMLTVSVFSSNAINILAGINGLEAGQSAVIASAVLCLNLASLPSLEHHAFSARLIAPFLGCCLGLLFHNAYPAEVFPGDAFTYFAGMTLSVAAILGHFTETLLVFMLPQVVNFLLSVPQLFGFVPCPRHRVPRREPSTGLLVSSGNFTLLNSVLRVVGPTSEHRLCSLLLFIQALSCLLAFALRSLLAGWYK